MKIEGILSAKGKRGVAKQLTPEKKAESTLKNAAAKFGEEHQEGRFLCFATDIKPAGDIHVSKSGDLFRGKYSNNFYRAKGSCTLNFREIETSKVHKPKKAQYIVDFKDALDHIGLPDTEVVKYEFKI